MGQQSSKPVSIQSSFHLNHLYSPHIHHHRLPGQPLLLRLNHPPKQKQKNDIHSQLQPTIQNYSFEICLSQEKALQYKKVFAQRKKCLPWHVKVLFWQLVKDECHCANNKYKGAVYTEHIETRLCHFRVSDPSRMTKYTDSQILDSFSLSQSIYLLINTLHGFQLLMEQFRVNYPTSKSIGINKKGQVKVWLCDNWALNTQNTRTIPQNLLIEQIINLIEQRTKDNLYQLLNLKYTYMDWTFDSIQEQLAEHTIHFNQGKKSLEKRICKMIADQQRKDKNTKKFPMNKVFTQESSKFSLQLPSQPQLVSPMSTSQRRPLSNQNLQKLKVTPDQQLYKMSKTLKHNQTPRTTFFQSPKRPLKFTYEQQSSVQPSPKLSVPTYSSSLVKESIKYQFSHEIPQNRPKVNSLPLIQKESHRTQYLSHPRIQEEHIMAKLIHQVGHIPNSNSRKKNIPVNLGCEAMVLQNVQKVQSAEMVQKTADFNPHKSPTKTVQFQIKEPQNRYHIQSPSSQSTPASQSSLTQITTQFKSLLQSAQKIKEEQNQLPQITSYDEVPLQYQNSEQSAKIIQDGRTFNQKSQQLLPSYWQINFQSIKEVDEDVSYSIDDKQ